ncbi:Putative ATP-dependent Lon protease [Nitrosotalea devaniterrae]|uniref:ATP-dependent Lon protease n=1 Tax=Nitrosotalea devaniterrae TaxID=1078905 RepID=A0A128A622_9ARCH|nr:Putative ATP-dependent Lon protease [Candidatus Nitrosotalea devanaterra]
MTSKKAVQIVEMLLEIKTRHKQNLEKPENDWGIDVVGRLVQREITSLSNEISWLGALKKEIAPPCKHPKKMQDMCEGQKYCMNCNLDL